MTELQIILIVCAVVFIGSLYWWGKKSKEQPIQRAYRSQERQPFEAEDDDFEVVPVASKTRASLQDDRRAMAQQHAEADTLATSHSESSVDTKPRQAPLFEDEETGHIVTPINRITATETRQDQDALAERVQSLPTTSATLVKESHEMDSLTTGDSSAEITAEAQPQIFALLVLSASQKFTRKQIHVAMEASRLTFDNEGAYVKYDSNGNIVFHVANVVEPGYFSAVDDDTFESPGVALVLQLPSSITPYRAMDEFITVARKVSQSLDAKLYDAQRHIIKESDLKTMRAYAQSLTYT